MEKVFDAATDIAGFQKTMPHRFPSVRILSVRDNVSIAEEHFMVARREFIMMVKHTMNRPHTHEMRVIGGDAKGSSIVERCSGADQGTRITMHVDLKMRGVMSMRGLLERNIIQNDFVGFIGDIAALAER